jgi:hypothetical protein
MKKLLLLLTLALCAPMTFAQNVPSYVPSDGLVGYWPFNGNANDVSGNGNNGTNNGATLTTDRFGNTNSAYSFNGSTSFIQLPSSIHPSQISVSLWVKPSSNQSNQVIIRNRWYGFGVHYNFIWSGANKANKFGTDLHINNGSDYNAYSCLIPQNINLNQWYNIVFTYDGTTYKVFLDNVLVFQSNVYKDTIKYQNAGLGFAFGRDGDNPDFYFKGSLDDVSIWNRALSQEEITNLYNANQCITNITVTDTLIINVGQLSFNDPVVWANNITIAPNPASTKININFNNITDLNGGTIKIINSLGQQVVSTPITLSGTNTTMPITTWGGKGLYFVQIINPQGQIVDIKKIILQ